MSSDRLCPCCEELIEPYGCSCGPSRSRETQRRWTPHPEDDLVIRLNDVPLADDDQLPDAS